MADDRNPGELSDEVWRVKTGRHYDRDGTLVMPGETFNPTVRQVRTGSLEGKAERVSGPTAVSTAGADIGLRALEWGSDAAMKKALDPAGDGSVPALTVEEMEAAGATGETGFVTKDVNRALAAREE